jgi:hypothetical protein
LGVFVGLRERLGKRKGCKGALREDQYHATGTAQDLWILGKSRLFLVDANRRSFVSMCRPNGHKETYDEPLSKCMRALVLGCLALLVCPVEAVDKFVDSGTKQRIDMHNWLQLRAEQEAYQQSVEPLSPSDRRNLELQLQVQRLQQRNLQLRQDHRLQPERHKPRINQRVDTYHLNRPGISSQQQGQQQQQQRLQMRMQRNIWAYPRNSD